MIDPGQLRELIVRPTLQHIGLHSAAAEDLLIGTAAAESHLGQHIAQVGGGPALGVWQVEPATHSDVWLNWLRFRPDDAQTVRRMVAQCWWLDAQNRPHHNALVSDLTYCCAIARLVYRRARDPLPKAGDWMALAGYWVKNYNRGGKGTEGKFLEAIGACKVA